MPSTSGTYNFQSVQIELLIREAFERIGILGEFTEYQKIDSAKRSIDLLLLDWMNKSVNLWTLQGEYLSLNTGQGQYTLSNTVSDIIQVNLRTSTRQLNGAASSNIRQLGGLLASSASSSGVAANAFDGDPLTACTQNAINGNISYDYGAGNTESLNLVAIISETLQNYTLSIQTSADNINWNDLQLIPIQAYGASVILQFIINVPIAARSYRILETGGATLNIQELYFVQYVPNNNASNAFDQDPTSAFIDILPNGSIDYDYGNGNSQYITFIGIQSNLTTLYSLVVEYSQDTITWFPLMDIPKQTFNKGITSWFDVLTPVAARAYRIRETGDAVLNFQEVYLNNNIYDFAISDVSRYEYLTYPNKKLQSRPSVYYLDRQIVPVLNLWPTPSQYYNCLFYSYKQMMQDAGAFYTNTIQIPARFYPALVWGLSWHLSLKYRPESAAMCKGEYDQSFNAATYEDSEGTAIRINGDYTNSGRI